MTIYNRAERQYYRKLKDAFGEDQVLLLQRPMLHFEKLLVDHLGGSPLFKELMGKDIDTTDGMVYDYFPLNEKLEFQRPMFFLVSNRADFEEIYQSERELQLSALSGQENQISTSLFANELMQLYQVVKRVLRRDHRDSEIYFDAAMCLPYHEKKYFYQSCDMMDPMA